MALWTEADVERLKAAIASGVLSVTYAGPPQRTVTYQSLDAMRALLAEMVRSAAGTSAVSHRKAAVSRGFGRSTPAGWRRRE